MQSVKGFAAIELSAVELAPVSEGGVGLGSPGPQADRGPAVVNHQTWRRRAVIM
jgi:hypothetical protein